MAFALLATLRDLVAPIGEAIRPRLSEVRILQERFLTGEQQDAHEFLSFLLEQIESEHLSPLPLDDSVSVDVNAVRLAQAARVAQGKLGFAKNNRPMPPKSASQLHRRLHAAPGLASIVRIRDEAGPILWRSKFAAQATVAAPASSARSISKGLLHLENPLSGLLESTLYCPHCNREWSTMQKMLNLSLYPPAGNHSTSLTLEECLRAFSSPEEVDGVWCVSCGQKRTLLKRMSFARSPRVLCLHLHRLHAAGSTFSGPTLRKTTTHIQFPMQLSVSPYSSSQLGSFARPPPRGALPFQSALSASYSSLPRPKSEAESTRSMVSSVLYSLLGGAEKQLPIFSVLPDEGPSLESSSSSLSRTSSSSSLADLTVPDLVDSEAVFEYEKSLLPNLALNRRGVPVESESRSAPSLKLDSSQQMSVTLRSFRLSVRDSPAVRYSLSAVIVHIGSASGGHYIAYKKVQTGSTFPSHQTDYGMPDSAGSVWVRISDDQIEIVDESFVLRAEAYMLFYS